MTDEERDDALSWAGDDDRIVPPARGITPPKVRPTERAQAARPDVAVAPVPDETAVPDAAPVQVGNVTLVALGLLGGIYLLFVIGWVIAGLGLRPVAIDGLRLDGIGYAFAMWVAALAPAIWFGTTLYLTRGARAWVRFAGLIVGVLVFVPWPFLAFGVGR